MLKIALVGQKGGVGKSTVSWLLVNAALARSDDTKVMLIETDSQGSSAMYHRRVTDKYPDLSKRFLCTVVQDEQTLLDVFHCAETEGFDYLIIDTAGHHEDLVRFVLTAADRVIVPFRPSVKEYESQLATIDLYKQLRAALEASGQSAPVAALLLNDWTQTQRITVRQKGILNTIYHEDMLASFYVPKRSGFDTLDQGVVFLEELQRVEVAKNPLVLKSVNADLQTAITTLNSIEAMK